MSNKYEIIFMEDSSDCELCGTEYAGGYQIYLDGVLIIDKHPVAHCYDASDYDPSGAYRDILELEGIIITVTDATCCNLENSQEGQ